MFVNIFTAENPDLSKAAYDLQVAYAEWNTNDRSAKLKVVSVDVAHERWTHPTGTGGMHYLVMTVCCQPKRPT